MRFARPASQDDWLERHVIEREAEHPHRLGAATTSARPMSRVG